MKTLLTFLMIVTTGLAASVPTISRTSENAPAGGYSPENTFPISLHGTRYGHDTFWIKEHGGLEALTERPIEDFGCKGCHPGTLADGTPVDPFTYKPSCADCHADPDNPTVAPVTDDICLKCHNRQTIEKQLLSGEAHKKFSCKDCHTAREMHGDENVYSSLHAPNATDVKCTSCHSVELIGDQNRYHKLHVKNIDCSSCHVQSVLACNSCHLDSILEGERVFAGPPHQGFKMLVRHDGKVHAATYMTITYQNESTFNVISPRYTHAIAKDTIVCGDCHGNSAIQEYTGTGKIKVVAWEKRKNALIGRQGIIPVPHDWKKALHFDYAIPTRDPDEPWMLLKGKTDLFQMLFAKPLLESQMDALKNVVATDTD